MPTGERQNLEIPREVVKLRNATLGGFPNAGGLYVSLDRDPPGPYSCVLVADDQIGEPEWKAMIVALPADFDCELASDPGIATALGMVESIGLTLLRDYASMRFLRRFEYSSQSDAPFAQIPPMVIGRIFDFIREDFGKSQNCAKLDAALQQTEERLGQTWGPMWSPLVLADIIVTGRHQKSWPIVMHWKRWTAETCDLKELTKKFHDSLGIQSASVKKKHIDAFRQRLRYLGLPSSTKRIQEARAASKP